MQETVLAFRLLQSSRSFVRGMNVAPDRAPFARPAIPIDNTAFSYHWSALKITRLIFFLSRRECESDFLALVDLEVPFFDIFYPPASLYPTVS